MDELVRRGIAQLKEKEGAERFLREPIERYQWPLAAGIMLIATSMFISEPRRKREDDRLPARGARITSAGQGRQFMTVR